MKVSRVLSWSVVVICVTLLAGTVAGCNSFSNDEEQRLPVATLNAVEEIADKYGYDAENEELTPVYVIAPKFHDPRDGLARDLLAQQCLAGVVEYPVMPQGGWHPYAHPRTQQPIFDLEIATEYGYPYLRNIEGYSSEHTSQPVSEEQLDAMIKCGERTDNRLGDAPDRLLVEIEAAGWEYSESDAELNKAIEDWRKCMDPLGIPDMHDKPAPLPPKSLVPDAFEATEVGDDAIGTVPLTEREREVAIVDATCRDKVDYDYALHVARAKGELIAIGSDLESFEATRVALDKYFENVEAVLAEFGK